MIQDEFNILILTKQNLTHTKGIQVLMLPWTKKMTH